MMEIKAILSLIHIFPSPVFPTLGMIPMWRRLLPVISSPVFPALIPNVRQKNSMRINRKI